MDIGNAAKRLHISNEKLMAWELGTDSPTVVQLRKLAQLYRQSFAAFYLPSPPDVFHPPTRDYRRLPGGLTGVVSPNLTLEMRIAVDRRDICLELMAEKGEQVPNFTSLTLSREGDPETASAHLRSVLGINWEQQKNWNDPRIAFNVWRDAIETNGVLVFQTSAVPLVEMRGFSVAIFPLPVVVVNRKDAYAGRLFSMVHELAHVMLHSSGLCDLEVSPQLSSQDQNTEVICNHIAGATLVPKDLLMNNPLVKYMDHPYWDDAALNELSQSFSVSREVILRRLLILDLTTTEYYQKKREQFLREYRRRRTTKGFVHPVTNVISTAGKTFTKIVFDAFNNGRITANDASDFFGLKTKHFEQLGFRLSHG
jgi:Zn-dependent peptidase ImmA (M78 family)